MMIKVITRIIKHNKDKFCKFGAKKAIIYFIKILSKAKTLVTIL